MESFERLQRRVPLVSDKTLVDLVNGIQISRGLVNYRKSQGFFGKLLDNLTGSDFKRQMLLEGNLVAGQEALHKWVLELTDSVTVSKVALYTTQTSLLEARNAIINHRQELLDHQQKLIAFGEEFNQLVKEIHGRVDQLESRLKKLEIKSAAKDDFDRIFSSWSAKETYTQLPWVFQVVFLVRQVFSSSVAIYEIESGDTEYFRDLLGNKIIAESQHLPDNFFDLYQLYDLAWQQLQSTDLDLAMGLLEIRSLPRERLVEMPYHFTLGTTLELASLPGQVRPEKPAESAIEICRSQVTKLDYTTDIRDFVRQNIQEIANDSITILSRSPKL
ncbi:diguanylate cyclase regulator RdcB family protein [Okeania sp. SIO1I7]|uniref:diguanylate cyclase regulator RdcB family protein n=1 Tax=Okeania sp. SIO1I7 TaxID=2607772 RepID=UPI0013F8D085|nr:diguanylate cyclase regulator RdcB family protein [Okeania sp. SIO1I7]NET28164.1 hypothetical protein [Okeania sp. SIO1I7]